MVVFVSLQRHFWRRYKAEREDGEVVLPPLDLLLTSDVDLFIQANDSWRVTFVNQVRKHVLSNFRYSDSMTTKVVPFYSSDSGQCNGTSHELIWALPNHSTFPSCTSPLNPTAQIRLVMFPLLVAREIHHRRYSVYGHVTGTNRVPQVRGAQQYYSCVGSITGS